MGINFDFVTTTGFLLILAKSHTFFTSLYLNTFSPTILIEAKTLAIGPAKLSEDLGTKLGLYLFGGCTRARHKAIVVLLGHLE